MANPTQVAGADWRQLADSSNPLVGTDERGLVVFWNEAAAQLYGIDRDQAIGRSLAELLGDRARRDGDSRFRALFESATTGIGLASLEPLRLVAVNRALADFVGLTPAELVRVQLGAVTHPDDWQAELERLRELQANPRPGGSYHMEKRYLRPDGTVVWGNLTVTLIDDPLAPSPLVLGIVEDITERRRVEEELRRREGELQAVLDTAPLAFVSLDPQGLVRRWSPAAERIFGWTAQEVIGRPYPLIPPGREEEFAELLARVLADDSLTGHETVRRRKDGTLVDVAIYSARFGNPSAGAVEITSFLTDITERKRVEQELRESQERYRSLVEMSPEPILVHRDGTFLYANPATARLLGVDSPARLIGHHALEFASPRSRPLVAAELDRLARERPDFERSDDTWELGNGVVLRVESTSRQIVYRGEPARQVIVRDVSARIGAEEAIRASREELRKLARRLQEVREQEQARLAREIHDELGQALTGIALDLGWLRRQTQRPGSGIARESLVGKLDELADAVEATLEAVKRLSLELHPLVVDLGLGPAVQWQVDSFCRRTGLVCDLDLGDLGELPPTCSTVLFRILQEALTNVARHAAARHVRVSLARRGDCIELAVADDGRGFEPLERRQGLGLVAMSERAQACNGTLEVRSAPGEGTEIHTRVEIRGNDKESTE